MKDRIINILVSVVMVVMSLYPMYLSLRGTVDEVNAIINNTNLSITLVNEDIVKFQNDLKDISSQVDSVKYELQAAIDSGLEDTKDLLKEKSEIKTNTVKDVKSKLDFIPDIKF